MTELYNLIQTNGPGVLIIIAILLFGKNLIEYFFSETIEFKKTELNQELENYKTRLEHENKNFQHTLDLKLNEFNIRFSKLHQDRAEVIKNLYYKLVELQSSMVLFTRRIHPIIENAEKEETERLERVNTALNDFVNYYMPNKIYFGKELAGKLDKLVNEYWDKGWDFSRMIKEIKDENISNELYNDFANKTREISRTVNKDFPKLIEDLENEFRKILGVK